MTPDDTVCYCFHVSLRKLVHYAQRQKMVRASQLSQCLNAGTGCGWCIPTLQKIHTHVLNGIDLLDDQAVDGLPDSADAYQNARKTYLRSDTKHSF